MADADETVCSGSGHFIPDASGWDIVQGQSTCPDCDQRVPNQYGGFTYSRVLTSHAGRQP